jgi:hypothetical protein
MLYWDHILIVLSPQQPPALEVPQHQAPAPPPPQPPREALPLPRSRQQASLSLLSPRLPAKSHPRHLRVQVALPQAQAVLLRLRANLPQVLLRVQAPQLRRNQLALLLP